jgi:hypothetical protein
MADSASSTAAQVVGVENLLDSFERVSRDRGDLRNRAIREYQARHRGPSQVMEVQIAQTRLVECLAQ